MDGQLSDEVGSRIRFHRLANGQTQEVVAGLAGITVDYLYQIERGRKLPALPVLVALARVLRVDAGTLIGPPAGASSSEAFHPSVALHRAMLAQPVNGNLIPLPDLRAQIDAAWRVWQTSLTRYSDIDGVLGDLVVEVERARRDTDNREAERLAADLYGLVRTVTKRTGHVDLSAVAADRALRAAEAAGDPLRVGAARWNVAHALLAQGHHDIVEDAAMAAAEQLSGRPGPGAAAVRGSLLQVAAIAAALTRRPQVARDRLRTAEPLARATGERNFLWTAFGPTNIGMHAVSVEVEAGKITQADAIAGTVDWQRSPSIERRIAFLLDQADGGVRRRDYGSALVLLQRGGRVAPEDLSRRPLARRLLGTVVRRAHHSTSREAAALAQRYAVPVI